MSVFLNSITSVMIILLITATGYIFGLTKWMQSQYKPFLEKYLMLLAIPCMCVDGFIRHLSPETLRGSWKIILITLLGVCACYLLSFIVAYLLRLPKKRAGVFIGMCAFSNFLFVGYPMCLELFGEESVLYVMLFFFTASFLVFIGSYSAFAWFSESNSGKKFDWDRLFRIFINPPIVSSVIGILIVIAGINLPRVLIGFAGYIGGTVSPLALFYCGFVIYESGIKNIRVDRGMVVMLPMRFVVASLIGFALCSVFGVHQLATSVIVVEMAMPVMTMRGK